jgi:hypothetical protein
MFGEHFGTIGDLRDPNSGRFCRVDAAATGLRQTRS